MQRALSLKVSLFLFAALGLNILFWLASSELVARWDGVPPVPSERGAVIMGLGDAQLSYRLGAITLQSLGNTPGQEAALRDYDYKMLGKWFWLLNGLDPASNDVPMVAAFYFGGTRVPKDVAIVVDYLSAIGQIPVGNKWRWLAHAVFLARHRMNNLQLALDLAYKLAHMQPVGDNLPIWARQMPAFVLAARGDKEDARILVENMLKSRDRWTNADVEVMKFFLSDSVGVSKKEIDAIMQMREDEGIETLKEPPKILPAPAP